jgi:hypothetical protein
MATVRWFGGVGYWTDGTYWSTGSPPGPADDAVIDGQVYLTSSTTVNSITIGYFLQVHEGATVSVTGDLTNSGLLNVDPFGLSGTTLVVGGTLTNSNHLAIGNESITSATTVSAGAFSNTGSLSIIGTNNSGTNARATLNIAAAAPTTWTGTGILVGDALLEFASGGITGIASGATLRLGYESQKGSGSRARSRWQRIRPAIVR